MNTGNALSDPFRPPSHRKRINSHKLGGIAQKPRYAWPQIEDRWGEMSSAPSKLIADQDIMGSIPSGMRCVICVEDGSLRETLVNLTRKSMGIVLVGVCNSGAMCDQLIDEYLPEILIVSSALNPRRSKLTPERWPCVLELAADSDDSSIRQELFCMQGRVLEAKAAELRELTERYFEAVGQRYRSSFAVLDAGRERVIQEDDVRFITVDGNYARLNTSQGRFRIRETLNNLASSLDPASFARIHRSVIVNLRYVERLELTPEGGSSVVLRDQTQLPVGPSFDVPRDLRDRSGQQTFAGSN